MEQVYKIVNFLIENQVSFDVPGSYTLPNQVVIDAIQEFMEKGTSELIKKHKDWTYACWDFEEMKDVFNGEKKYDSFMRSPDMELKKFKELKEFWYSRGYKDAKTDMKLLEYLIEIEENGDLDSLFKGMARKEKKRGRDKKIK